MYKAREYDLQTIVYHTIEYILILETEISLSRDLYDIYIYIYQNVRRLFSEV